MEMREPLIADLGFAMARVSYSGSRLEPQLTIVVPAYEGGEESGSHVPASSVEVYGRRGILALRRMLEIAVPGEEVKPS